MLLLVAQTAPSHAGSPVHWGVLIGWPAVVLGLVLALVGIAGNRAGLVAVAGLLLVPLGGYASLTPRAPWAVVLPVGCWVAAWLLKRGHRNLALCGVLASIAGAAAIAAMALGFV
jgi:hypothetical protein